jgi:hypothetical protein
MTFTTKLLGSLTCAGILAIPGGASALDTVPTYDAFIYQDRLPVPVGQIELDENVDLPFTACGYFYTWTDPSGASATVGFVDEAKTLAHRGCIESGFVSFPTFVQLDQTAAAGGFDPSLTLQEVSGLVLGEASSGVLSGTIQFAAAVPVAASIVLQPAGLPAPPPLPAP